MSSLLTTATAIAALGNQSPEKWEGLAVGPQLANGRYLILAGTDNDYSITQNGTGTQFDVYIKPGLEGVSAGDFQRNGEVADMGRVAALASADAVRHAVRAAVRGISRLVVQRLGVVHGGGDARRLQRGGQVGREQLAAELQHALVHVRVERRGGGGDCGAAQ